MTYLYCSFQRKFSPKQKTTSIVLKNFNMAKNSREISRLLPLPFKKIIYTRINLWELQHYGYSVQSIGSIICYSPWFNIYEYDYICQGFSEYKISLFDSKISCLCTSSNFSWTKYFCTILQILLQSFRYSSQFFQSAASIPFIGLGEWFFSDWIKCYGCVFFYIFYRSIVWHRTYI